MYKTYAISVSEKNLDLIEFLNDGVRPQIEEKPTHFVFTIVTPNEITSKIEYEDDLYDDSGYAIDESMIFVI